MHWIRNEIVKVCQPGGRLFRGGAFLIAILSVSACSVPKHMRVRSGIDPRHQDDDVRFRTTYFFRVFDLCADRAGKDNPSIDSLYRFRMTGKASGLFSKVHFESGTLKKWEIEPFGSNVVFDRKLGRFRFESHQDTEEQAEREARYAELQRRLELLEKIEKIDKMVSQDAKTQIREKITESVKKLVDDLDGPQGAKNSGGTQADKTKDSCPQSITRGFQIFGPEGVRTFDQNDRLIMAMSSSGKPLIGPLKELAARVLNEHPTEAETLLALGKERLVIIQAERQLEQIEHDPPEKSKEIVTTILDNFKN